MLLRNTLFIVLFITVSSSQQTFLAVHDFEGKGVSGVEASALTDRLRTEIISMGQVSVVERAEMDEILREQGYQQTGCFTSECMVEVGKLIGAEKIVSGSISKVGNTFSVNARLINVETGEIENSITYDLSGVIDELLISGMRNVSQLLFTTNKSDYIELNTTYEYYDNGQVKSEGQLIGDIKVGRWIYYHDNGRIQEIGAYLNNKEIGQWTCFYPDGNKRQEGSYKDGKLDDLWTYYYSDGNKEKEGSYKDGKLDGQWNYYFPKVQLFSQVSFNSGKVSSNWKIYNTDGKFLNEITTENINIEKSYMVLCGPSDETITLIKYKKTFLSDLFKEIAFFHRGEIIEYYPSGEIMSTVPISGKANGTRVLFSKQGDTLNVNVFYLILLHYTSFTYEGYNVGRCRDYNAFSMTNIGRW